MNMYGQNQRRDREDGAPKVGDVAPVFALETLKSGETVDIGHLVGKRPIVLIFGSYT